MSSPALLVAKAKESLLAKDQEIKNLLGKHLIGII